MSSDPNLPGADSSSPLASDRPLVWPPQRSAASDAASPAPSSAARGSHEVTNLQEEFNSLRSLFQVTVVAMILLLGVVNILLFHQVRLLRRQAFEVQTSVNEMTRIVGDYETNSVPMMDRFMTELRRFAERNPEFATVLSKYSMGTNAPVARPSTAPPGTSAPIPR